MTSPPGSSDRRETVWMVVGILFIFVGVLSNEWVLTSVLSADGVISPLSKNIIRIFEVVSLVVGVVIVKYRRGLSPLLSVKVGSLFILSTLTGFALVEFGSFLGLKYVLDVPMEDKQLERVLYIWNNDSEILPYGIKRNFRQVHKTHNFRATIRTNNVGMREDADYHGEKVDIGFVGDSFTFGFGVNYGERYSDLLRDYFPNKNVLSYGFLSGLTPPHYYLFMKGNPQYMPEILIMGLFPHNDFSLDTSDMKLTFDDEGEPVAAKFVIRYVSDSGALGVSWDTTNLRFLKTFLNESYTGKLLWLAWKGIVDSYNERSANALKDEWNRRSRPDQPATDVDDPEGIQVVEQVGYPDAIFDENSKIGLEYIERLNKYSAEHGTRLLVFMIPYHLQVLKRFDDPLWGPVKQWLSNRKIEVIDPLDEFTKYVEGGTQLYYRGEMHWNRNGHKVAAEMIFDYLANSRNLAAEPTQIVGSTLAVE